MAGAHEIFVSYSRRDAAFVAQLSGALVERGRRVWIDQDHIPPASRWRQELIQAVEAADTVVFVISPEAVASPHCVQELEHAVALGTRIVPVLHREAEQVPEALASRQYVMMRAQDDRQLGLEALVRAIETDLDWVRGHTRRLEEAMRWEAAGRDRGSPVILRGHRGRVNAVAVATDGRSVVAGGSDGTVRVWDLGDAGVPVVLAGHRNEVIDVSFSPDGRTIYSVSDDDGVLAWGSDFCGPLEDLLRTAAARVTLVLTDEERTTFLHER